MPVTLNFSITIALRRLRATHIYKGRRFSFLIRCLFSFFFLLLIVSRLFNNSRKCEGLQIKEKGNKINNHKCWKRLCASPHFVEYIYISYFVFHFIVSRLRKRGVFPLIVSRKKTGWNSVRVPSIYLSDRATANHGIENERRKKRKESALL